MYVMFQLLPMLYLNELLPLNAVVILLRYVCVRFCTALYCLATSSARQLVTPHPYLFAAFPVHLVLGQ